MTDLKHAAKLKMQKAFNLFGYYISRIDSESILTFPNRLYERVSPAAYYAPWAVDRDFQNIYDKVKNNTIVDSYRCYELWSLVEQSAKIPGGLIEIGVWQGGTGALIASRAKDCGIENKVYLCETFQGVVKTGPKDGYYKGGEHGDTTRALVESLLFDRLSLDNVEILEGIFPDETSHLVEETCFRFCHIDVDAYQSAKDIMDWLWERMSPGGIVVFDDYGCVNCGGIVDLVHEMKQLPDRIFLHNLNGHAVFVKI